LRLKGWEIDDVEWGRKSFGNQYALPKPFCEEHELTPIMTKLVQKTCFRLRQNNYACQGVHYSVAFRDGTHWHMGMKTQEVLFATSDIYKRIFRLYRRCPYVKPVSIMAVSVFNLVDKASMQLDLFADKLRQENLYEALDRVNERWGRFVITPARMIGTNEYVQDRIAFGGIREVEQMLTQ
jgi:DNA polymerase-4